MEYVSMIISAVVLGIVYVKMIKCDKEPGISKAQAIIPIVLGVVALPLSFVFVITTAITFMDAGISGSELPLVASSLYSGFFRAGFSEEIAKLIMILISLLIFRRRVKNVYEYILVGAGVGFGFTIFEEFLYGSEGVIVAVLRLLLITSHMLFGIVMAKHLGLARYHKVTKQGSAAMEYIAAIAFPVIIHTLYDACNGMNKLLDSDDNLVAGIGLIMVIVSFVGMFIWQVFVLKRIKRNAEKYCAYGVLDVWKQGKDINEERS